MPSEFDIIETYFAPLAGKEGVGLKDDAAHYCPSPSKKVVLSKDMLVESIHFLPDTNAEDLAWKALAVNISDLVAKGAKPKGYLLGLGLPAMPTIDWLKSFAHGLDCAQTVFKCQLFGGDTVRTNKDLTFSVTVIGEADVDAPLRSGAKAGDHIYVSGSLGGACYGLKSFRKEIAKNADLEQTYLRPQPRMDLISLISNYASASADISDGLVADIGHIVDASSVGAHLKAEDIPVNELINTPNLEEILTWGDDYEIVFTVDPSKEEEMLSYHDRHCSTPIHKIGLVKNDQGVTIVGKDETILSYSKSGFNHF
ncbi:thiamine-phosphate kinase [Temperatibacter marinus]|uniref:Thiamine-monophosphate kinase n=1 Tax=Temperatibacter marinus TaxID=1456591 RepID=A0AA52ECL2_9PROT|nr:thiamine-phosphate kinase [Temperatibacter marinus]WND02235.1 thiamine-phosphate kinase [Temperatibacter marinus]